MKIKLSPVLFDTPLSVLHVNGDKITINDITLDLSPLKIGEILPVSAIDPACGITESITRDASGLINITIRLPHGPNAPKETTFPDAYYTPIIVTSGDVPLPPYNIVVGEEVTND